MKKFAEGFFAFFKSITSWIVSPFIAVKRYLTNHSLIEKLASENKATKDSLHVTKSQISQLETSNKELLSKNEVAQNQIIQLEISNNDLLSKNEAFVDSLKITKEQLESQELIINSLLSENNSLLKNSTDTEYFLDKLCLERKKLHETIKHYKLKNSEFKDVICHNESENAGLLQQLALLKAFANKGEAERALEINAANKIKSILKTLKVRNKFCSVVKSLVEDAKTKQEQIIEKEIDSRANRVLYNMAHDFKKIGLCTNFTPGNTQYAPNSIGNLLCPRRNTSNTPQLRIY